MKNKTGTALTGLKTDSETGAAAAANWGSAPEGDRVPAGSQGRPESPDTPSAASVAELPPKLGSQLLPCNPLALFLAAIPAPHAGTVFPGGARLFSYRNSSRRLPAAIFRRLPLHSQGACAHGRSPPPQANVPPDWRRGPTNERGRCWGTMRAAVWNARAALLYSLGGWTMLGAMLHYSSESGGGPENESDPQENNATRKEVFTRETVLGLKVTTVVTYKDVQPPITRLLRRVKSFFDSNDDPPSGN
ncbi:small integral membrane protein 26 [Balearica regulorum gibbericeps]|uniref:small integral membrane protein 26 n=1 Tax=Balearica regulorum gibbericeps TaxID=100784 RepID=UPI003F6417AD